MRLDCLISFNILTADSFDHKKFNEWKLVKHIRERKPHRDIWSQAKAQQTNENEDDLKSKVLTGLLVTKGMASCRSLLFDEENFSDESFSLIVVSILWRDWGVETDFLPADKMNWMSGSVGALALKTKPGVMFPSSVNVGERFRCRRKRKAWKASSDKCWMSLRNVRIDGLVSKVNDVTGW